MISQWHVALELKLSHCRTNYELLHSFRVMCSTFNDAYWDGSSSSINHINGAILGYEKVGSTPVLALKLPDEQNHFKFKHMQKCFTINDPYSKSIVLI